VTFNIVERQYPQVGTNAFADDRRSLRELQAVCLFSALGLMLTAVAMILGWFNEAAYAFTRLTY